ncbi:MAG: DNA polymerase III subunit gamma/tau [Planctomycetaceae bacterium]|nr:DNA polymerase III subunit gamma/tau [Planctomycetaceae bacterium]
MSAVQNGTVDVLLTPVISHKMGRMEADHAAGSGNYQVVARRYRPKDFDELVGQTHIAHALSNAITSGRIGHAYLFTGARGVGKTSTARIYAKALNCAQGSTLTPCGQCDSCISISTGDDIDVLEIDAASNRGIEEIRQLRQNASIRPSRSRFKIYILDEVHMLTKEAFNALLKILEEPPGHVKFIFCTTEPTKIPITILSRCQRFDFAGIDTKQIADRLASIAENEKVTAEDGVFDTLARRAAGSMRDAQSLLEQLLSFAPQHIALADVHDMLGTANDQLLFRLLEGTMHGGQSQIFAELDSAASQGVDFGVLAEQMMGLYRDLLVSASGGEANLLLSCSPQQFEQVKTFASELGLHRILAAMQILDHTHTRMQRSTQARILMELALIRIANLDHFHQVSVLLEELRSGQPAPAIGQTPSQTVKAAHRMIAPPQPNKLAPPRVPVSSYPERVGLSGLDDAKAKSVWFEAMESIPGALGSRAMKCTSLRFIEPNVFAVVFDDRESKELCEKESARLQGVLSQSVGAAVKVHFELAAAEDSGPRLSDREQYLAATENPLVLKIQQTFGVKLHEVRR